MALSKKTINKHNLKRAEVFAQNGLCNLDVAFAHPKFLGYAQDAQDCVLCGHKDIQWLFAIEFAAPDMITMIGKIDTGITRTQAVTLKPVGSKCIQDWLDAIPESVEKTEALKRWAVEMDRCKKAMTAKVVEDLCAKAGFATPADAVAAAGKLDLSWSSPVAKGISQDERHALRNYSWKITHKTASRETVKKYLAALLHGIELAKAASEAAKAVEPDPTPAPVVAVPVATPAPAPVPAAKPDPTTDLLLRADAVIADAAAMVALGPKGQDALKDILAKVRRYGSFISASQRSYFTALVVKGEEAVGKVVEDETTAPVINPGDPGFTSASGISGARY
jgi:hypothetical protein